MQEESMSRKAVEMALSVGSAPQEPAGEWQQLAVNGAMTTEQLGRIGAEIPFLDPNWQNILTQSGPWLLALFEQKIANIQSRVVEQATAIELRLLFGRPASLLAMPVFLELEKMEYLARLDLKTEAASIERIWEQIEKKIFYQLQLFLAEQIEILAKEEKAHAAALLAARSQASGIESLSTSLQKIERQFADKLADLKQQKELLLFSFQKISGQIPGSIKNLFQQTIFSASRQAIEPMAIG